MAQGFSLKDQLFNASTLGDLAAEYSAALPDFDAQSFLTEVLSGLEGRELMARLDWIADCVEKRLAGDFPTMASQLEAAMPDRLDPTLRDDDFGRFIHAVPGILAVRHGLETHASRALDLLHEATQRFSMEFYIRPFLDRWPEDTLARLSQWATDENYHVRRLVSEGTRPKLPWAKKITLDPLVPLPFLTTLHADSTRFVTRSVANHLNDIAKFDGDLVVATLRDWRTQGRQVSKELDWMTRHALRTLVKQGHVGALELLGFHADAPAKVASLVLAETRVPIGSALEISLTLATDAPHDVPVMVDYILRFHRPKGGAGEKVFKLKQTKLPKNGQVLLTKKHPLKGDTTTFRLYPGPHTVAIQVNGRVLDEVAFELVPAIG